MFSNTLLLFLICWLLIKLQIISLSASANKLSNIQKQAKEYAALIMEELDPDNAGFIMVRVVHYLHPLNHTNGICCRFNYP